MATVVDAERRAAAFAERARIGRRAGHESAGVTAPATSWFLAEGATGDYFDMFILIPNATGTDATVRADYLLPSGQVVSRDYVGTANSRFNALVDLEAPELANTAVSTTITATNDVPIVVERAPGPTSATWAEAHNSPGGLPESSGKRFGVIVETVGPSPAQIVVERAMYSNANGVRWAAGTDALANDAPVEHASRYVGGQPPPGCVPRATPRRPSATRPGCVADD